MNTFEKFSFLFVRLLASPILFALSWVFVGVWIATGSTYHYSNAWQFAMNQPLTIGSWFATIITLYVADTIQKKQAALEEMERERQKHIEELVTRMEAQNLAIIQWLRFIAEGNEWQE